jgi:hypothetical protein
MRGIGAFLLTAAVASVVAAPAAAGAAGPRSATFNATIVGTQTSSAKLETSGGECGSTGTSTETIEFASSRPFKVRTTAFNSTLTVGQGNRDGEAQLVVRGTVTRSNEGAITCLDDPSRPRDCGTKPFSNVQMVLQEGKHSGVRWAGFNLGGRDLEGPSPFSNCLHLARDAFPGIADGDGVELKVSRSTLLDRRRRTIVVTGTSTVTGEGGYGARGTGTVTVKLTLKRIGG